MAAAFDEIWAPTEYVLQSLNTDLSGFGGTTRIVPYAADANPPPPPTAEMRDAVRGRLCINASTRVVGYSFAAASNYYRKNPEAAIDAFEDAFADDRSVILFLRCSDLAYFPVQRDRLLQRMGQNTQIWLFTAENHLPIDDFYAAIDVYISTSRAEGYGLNLVEAAQAEIPVVTTGWRLPDEIAANPLVHTVDYDLVPVIDPQSQYTDVPAARWAEPRRADLVAELLLRCPPARM